MNKAHRLAIILTCTAAFALGCEDTTIRASVAEDTPPKVTEKNCNDACSGTSKCADDSNIKLCRDEDHDGCNEWVLEPCGDNMVCKDNACEKSKTNPSEPQQQCEKGATECDGTSALRTCIDDGQNGTAWKTETCPDNTECSEGSCVSLNPACSDECTESTRCSSESGYQTCEDTDGDGCREWSDEVRCASDLICRDGACKESQDIPACTDECTNGEHQCDGTTGYRECQDTDGDGCTEWSDVVSCDSNRECRDGACVDKAATCQNDCTKGAKQCDGTTGYKECKDTDGDGCTEWSDVVSCGSNKECRDGACVDKAAACTDSCSGSAVCDGDSKTKVCKDTNGDGCREWSSTACSQGLKCSSGACVCKYTSAEDPGIHPMPGQGGGTGKTTTANGYTDEYLIDATGAIKIGARRDWGGSIIFFGEHKNSDGTNGTNTIDGNDTGREVQVAIYDASRIMQGCAYNASCGGTSCPNSITYLGWNPVQGGNRCNRGSGVDSVTNKNGIMEIVTTPLHWNPNWDASDCTSNGCSVASLQARKSDVRLTQRLRFISPLVVELFYSIVNTGGLSHSSTNQELPTLYAAYGAHGLGNYNKLLSASKQEITIDTPANDGFYMKSFTSPEPWVTLQNANLDYGVGILYENGLLTYTGWQKAGVFNNVRSNIAFGLPANGTVNARAYLLLGSYDTIKANAQNLIKTIPPFGALDAPDGKTKLSGKVTVSGWALDNTGVTSVIARIDETKEFKLTYGSSRPDVCSVWVGYPKCNNVGYSGTIDLSGLSNACGHLLEIIASDGTNTRTIARRIIQVQ